MQDVRRPEEPVVQPPAPQVTPPKAEAVPTKGTAEMLFIGFFVVLFCFMLVCAVSCVLRLFSLINFCF